MISAAFRALAQTFAPPQRQLLWRILGLTLLILIALGAAAQGALSAIPELGIGWADWSLEILARFFGVILLIPLAVPVTSLVAGFFLESLAARIEAQDYPGDAPGRDQSTIQSLRVALTFALVLLVVNLAALPLYLIPLVNVGVFWLVNGYLMGREYFELVALRHLGPAGAAALRRAHRGQIWAAGFLMALFASVPLVNLLAPLFGVAFMVHLFKGITKNAG